MGSSGGRGLLFKLTSPKFPVGSTDNVLDFR